MSKVGFYRYKTLADSEKDVSFYINSVLSGTKSVVPLDYCDQDLIVKYLDKNGQYRFYSFNSYHEIRNQPEKIGSVNKFVVNIETDQSNESNVGYTNTKQILASTDVTEEIISVFSDIYTSPRVYLYVGDGSTDIDNDWLEVELTADNPISKIRRGNTYQIDVSILLPEYHTIKMI